MVSVTQVIQMNLNGRIGQAGKGMKQEPQEQGRDNSNDFRINIFRLGRNWTGHATSVQLYVLLNNYNYILPDGPFIV